jgi:hypothetical protein
MSAHDKEHWTRDDNGGGIVQFLELTDDNGNSICTITVEEETLSIDFGQVDIAEGEAKTEADLTVIRKAAIRAAKEQLTAALAALDDLETEATT